MVTSWGWLSRNPPMVTRTNRARSLSSPTTRRCDEDDHHDREAPGPAEGPAYVTEELLVEGGGLERDEAYRVFNMGIGMVLVVRRKDRPAALAHFKRLRLSARDIGHIAEGRRGLTLE